MDKGEEKEEEVIPFFLFSFFSTWPGSLRAAAAEAAAVWSVDSSVVSISVPSSRAEPSKEKEEKGKGKEEDPARNGKELLDDGSRSQGAGGRTRQCYRVPAALPAARPSCRRRCCLATGKHEKQPHSREVVSTGFFGAFFLWQAAVAVGAVSPCDSLPLLACSTSSASGASAGRRR